MILVDVYIPSVDETYDFFLDENTEVEKIVVEIYEMLVKKMQSAPKSNINEFMLYHMTAGKALDKNRTLAFSGVTDGSRLMLV